MIAPCERSHCRASGGLLAQILAGFGRPSTDRLLEPRVLSWQPIDVIVAT
jgi:hypothetical protein